MNTANSNGNRFHGDDDDDDDPLWPWLYVFISTIIIISSDKMESFTFSRALIFVSKIDFNLKSIF